MRKFVRLSLLALTSAALLPAAHGFAQSQAPRQATDSDEGDDPDRVICRRSVDTGSLVKGRRQCFTRAQWDRIAEAAQKRTQDMQDNLRTRPSGE